MQFTYITNHSHNEHETVVLPDYVDEGIESQKLVTSGCT